MAVVAKPILLLIKNSLAAISFRAVRKNGGYSFSRAETFGDLVRRSSCGAGRPAAEKPFKPRDLLECCANFVVLDHQDLIRQRRIVNLWNKVALSDAFNLLWSWWFAAINRSFRFHQHTQHVPIKFPHRSRDTAEGARRSRADHDCINLAVHL